MAKYTELAQKIIEKTGGKENITASWHCVTRLRFNYVDKSKINIDEMKKIKGVMGAQFSGEQFQVIIGNDVANVYETLKGELGDITQQSASGGDGEKKDFVGTLLDIVSGIFTPILPALVGTGLLKGVVSFLTAFNLITAGTTGFELLTIISDVTFYFLPFMLAVSSARKFKTNEYLAMCLAGAMLYPTMVNGYNAMLAGEAVESMALFGILPMPFLAYSSSVLPIMLATFVLKYVYDFMKKVVPSVVSVMFAPMLTLLVMIPLTLIVFGPLGTYIGALLSMVLSWLFGVAGFLAAAAVGAFYPLLVMTGMHWALMPMMLTSFNTLGYDAMMAPAMLGATFAMAGSTWAVFFKTKNEDMKQISLSAAISAVLGITEPAMYGVTMKLKKPFTAALIGGGVSGLVMNILKVKSFGMAMPGLIALPGYVDPSNGSNIIFTLIGSVLAFGIAFAVTYAFGFNEEEEADDELSVAESTTTQHMRPAQIELIAPVDGTVIPVDKVKDNVFAEQIMGQTFAIQPTSNTIIAPIDGEVVMVAPSKHAIGLKSQDGLEILLHLGIDTVELAGEPFDMKVKIGDKVKAQDTLVTMDIDTIRQKNYDPIVLTIITNSHDYLDVIKEETVEAIQSGDKIETVIK